MKRRINVAVCFMSLFASTVCCQKSVIKKRITHSKEVPNYIKRNDYYIESRGLNAPDAPVNYAAYKDKIYKTELKKRKSQIQNSQRSNSGNWQSDGPAVFDNYTSVGRVNRVAFHPTDVNIIYAATAGGGLWYTPNHGTIWYPLTDHIPNMNLSGVVVDEYNPDILYVLTGDGDGTHTSFKSYGLSKYSSGVLKSYDHGQTWSQTGLSFGTGDNVRAYNLDVHPIYSDILFASTSNGLYKTINGGVTWNNVLNEEIFEIKYNPENNFIMYAVDAETFYKSTDGGDTWNSTVTIPKLDDLAFRMTMATCENDPDRVYLYTAPKDDSTGVHRGLFLSDDIGESFIKVDSTTNMDGGRQGKYDLAVACAPSNSDHVIISKVRAYKSTNAGSSFSLSDGMHADHHQLIVNPLLPDRLYIATDGGLYYSDSFGDSDSWVYISEYMRISQYYKIAVGQTNPELVIAGSQDCGTHLNANASAVYTRVFGKDGMDCAIHPSNDSLIILSSQSGDFEISNDMAQTTSHLIDEFDVDSTVGTYWVTPVAWDPTNPANIYIGYNPVFRSFDGGATFNPIPDTVGGNRLLYVGIENPATIIASDCYDYGDGCEYHLHRSIDFGNQWFPIHLALPDSTLKRRKTGITSNPDNSQEIWVTLAGFDPNNKVFRSTNGGFSWANMTGSLPNIPVNCIIQQNTDGGPFGAVYIGTDIGVYYRDDSLGDWIYFSNDMPAVEVSDLEIQYDSQTLYAGTFGRGVWTSDLYSDCPQEYILNSNLILPERDYFFQASDSISLSDYTIESYGSNMKLKAGNVILIQDGFVAKSDNKTLFKARLSPCGGGIENYQKTPTHPDKK